MKNTIQDKAVVLTGGSRGIGQAVALKLAEEGARLAIAARNEIKLKETENLIKAKGSTCTAIPCDVTSDDSVNSMVEQAAPLTGDDLDTARKNFEAYMNTIADFDPGVKVYQMFFGKKGGLERALDMFFGR